jgi:hypothetical protein
MPPNSSGPNHSSAEYPLVPPNTISLGDKLRRWGPAVVAAGSLAISLLVPGDSSLTTVEHGPTFAGLSVIDGEYAARTGDQNCSAFLLRAGGTGEADGAITAAHCNLTDPSKLSSLAIQGGEADPAWFRSGSNKKTYVVEANGAQLIQIGSVSNHMKTVGEANQVLTSTNGDVDEALMVFKGHTLKEVLNDLKAETASAAEIAALIPGQDLLVAGWPELQEGDHHGNQELQSFAATYIGSGKTTEVDTGKTTNVLWLAFPKNEDGATCSPGVSGSGAVAMVTGEHSPSLVSIATKQDSGPLDPNYPSAPEIVQENPDIDWTQFASVCAFSTLDLTTYPDTLLQVVESIKQIPNLEVDTAAQANDLLGEPGYTTDLIRGTVIGRIGGMVDAFKNPIAYVNSDGTIALASRDGASIELDIQEFASISNLTVYPDAPGAPKFSPIPSPIRFVGKGSDILGGFTDPSTGLTYAAKYTTIPSHNQQSYRLVREGKRVDFLPTP